MEGGEGGEGGESGVGAGQEEPEPEPELELESAHAALRNNRDYIALLGHAARLELLRARALRDAEELAAARAGALLEPHAFLQALRAGRVRLPGRLALPPEPRLDRERYGLGQEREPGRGQGEEQAEGGTMVRGRKFDESKPDTYNQLWSCEEQRRLEELLLQYPEEDVEVNRYKKIAAALGTRTPSQICSRVQKYFAKLAKAGLPIPGRNPKNMRCRRTLNTKLFQTKSTFFPEFYVPVKMEDASETFPSVKSEPIEEKPYRGVVELLKMAKDQRLMDRHDPVVQRNTRCSACNKTGFVGARWTDNAGTDYCTDCIVRLQPAEKLIPIREPL